MACDTKMAKCIHDVQLMEPGMILIANNEVIGTIENIAFKLGVGIIETDKMVIAMPGLDITEMQQGLQHNHHETAHEDADICDREI